MPRRAFTTHDGIAIDTFPSYRHDKALLLIVLHTTIRNHKVSKYDIGYGTVLPYIKCIRTVIIDILVPNTINAYITHHLLAKACAH